VCSVNSAVGCQSFRAKIIDTFERKHLNFEPWHSPPAAVKEISRHVVRTLSPFDLDTIDVQPAIRILALDTFSDQSRSAAFPKTLRSASRVHSPSILSCTTPIVELLLLQSLDLGPSRMPWGKDRFVAQKRHQGSRISSGSTTYSPGLQSF
jgi:hypothetical protein